MTIVSALKKLHKKMTGKDATGLNIAGVIDSLQANYTGGGGGEIVTATLGNFEAFPKLHINQPSMSAAEMIAASNNKPVTMIAQDESGNFVFAASLSVVANGVATFLGYLYYGGDVQYVAHADAYDDGSETFVALEVNQLPPPVTNLDNGKVLGVVDDAYALVAALPLVIHATDNSGTITITDTVTIAQIKEAAAANRAVFMDVADGASVARYNYNGNTGGGTDTVVFSATLAAGGTSAKVNTLSFSDPASVTKTEVLLTGTNP